jgi:hypothetical protein
MQRDFRVALHSSFVLSPFSLREAGARSLLGQHVTELPSPVSVPVPEAEPPGSPQILLAVEGD